MCKVSGTMVGDLRPRGFSCWSLVGKPLRKYATRGAERGTNRRGVFNDSPLGKLQYETLRHGMRRRIWDGRVNSLIYPKPVPVDGVLTVTGVAHS